MVAILGVFLQALLITLELGQEMWEFLRGLQVYGLVSEFK